LATSKAGVGDGADGGGGGGGDDGAPATIPAVT